MKHFFHLKNLCDFCTSYQDISSYPDITGKRIPIRVNGIDTPELRAKQLTVSLLRGAKVIELRNMQQGKYFRIIADVFVDSKSLGRMLIKKGFAVPYDKIGVTSI